MKSSKGDAGPPFLAWYGGKTAGSSRQMIGGAGVRRSCRSFHLPPKFEDEETGLLIGWKNEEVGSEMEIVDASLKSASAV